MDNLIIANRDPTFNDKLPYPFWFNQITKELFQFDNDKWVSLTKIYIEREKTSHYVFNFSLEELTKMRDDCHSLNVEYGPCVDSNKLIKKLEKYIRYYNPKSYSDDVIEKDDRYDILIKEMASLHVRLLHLENKATPLPKPN